MYKAQKSKPHSEPHGKPTRNDASPNVTDFRVDVRRAVEQEVTDLELFAKAYVFYDSEDYIEREVHAEKLMGPHRHDLEQRLGQRFIRLKLYPHTKYFQTMRKKDGQ